MMSIYLIGFLIGQYRKTLHISSFGRFYKIEGFGGGSDREELVGVTHRR
jgi:hypothetical protein